MKLFASDYDGTYKKHHSRKKGEIEANIEATRKWRQNGNLFAFSTGRAISLMEIEKIRHEIEYDYIIGLNGAIIVSESGEIVFRKCMPTEVATAIVKLIQSEHIGQFMVTDGMNGYQKISFSWTNKYWYLFQILKLAKGFFNLSLTEALNKEVVQVAVKTNSPAEAEAFAKKVNHQFGDYVIAFPNLVHVDICAKGLSKASGIEHIAKVNKIEKADIYCIGDSFNDLPMINAFHGFTMIEAVDTIKNEAEAVFDTVKDAIEFVQ